MGIILWTLLCVILMISCADIERGEGKDDDTTEGDK